MAFQGAHEDGARKWLEQTMGNVGRRPNMDKHHHEEEKLDTVERRRQCPIMEQL